MSRLQANLVMYHAFSEELTLGNVDWAETSDISLRAFLKATMQGEAEEHDLFCKVYDVFIQIDT
eukprot:1387469-Amorphochlora_amoeboformis.AAC.1